MATSIKNSIKIPELYPQPKLIIKESGKSELLPDVRLATMSVLPIQRKAIRSILTMSGVRVVANKKKYVVDARVEDPAEFDLSKVPTDVRRDYYELRVIGSEMQVRSPYQEGMVWAAQTMAQLFHLSMLGHEVPNLLIKDWPDRPDRGVMINCGLGSERMSAGNWYQIIDALSAVKMNVLEMEVYGHSTATLLCEEPENEYLYMGLPQDEEESVLESIPNRLRWYNVKHFRWYDEAIGPMLALHNQLPDVITYGKERGVEVIPFFGTFSKTTSFKLMGNVISKLNCWTSAEGKKSLEAAYDHLLTQYGIDEEGIRALPIDPSNAFACGCKTCAANKSNRLAAYVKWIGSLLFGKGVKNLVLLADRLPGKNKTAIDADFATAMETAKIKDRIIVQCSDKAAATAYAKLGFKVWLAGHADVTVNTGCADCTIAMDQLVKTADSAKVSGMVLSTIYDPSNLEYLATGGCASWESLKAVGKLETARTRWSFNQFEENEKAVTTYYDAVAALNKLVDSDLFRNCLPQLEYVDKNGAPTWPECVLANLDSAKKAAADLETMRKSAAKIAATFEGLLQNDKLNALQNLSLESLKADALRVQTVAIAFSGLLDLYQQVKKGGLKKTMSATCDKLIEEMRKLLGEYEQIKPDWLIPATMQPFAYIILFINQVKDAAAKATAKKSVKNLWVMPKDWEMPEVY